MPESNTIPNLKFYPVILRNVPIQYQDSYILQSVTHRFGNAIQSIKRIKAYPDWKPTTFISIHCADLETQRTFLNQGHAINQKLHQAELPRKNHRRPQIYRCYRCQEIHNTFSHRARDCTNVEKCVQCSQTHNDRNCKQPAHCANCSSTQI